MQRLAVFLMIPALVLLSTAMGAAQDADWGGIHSIKGVYAVTGFSTCNATGPGILEGDYTFNGNGTGSAQGVVRSLSPNASPPPAAFGTYMNFTVTFEYDVTKDGRITFLYPAGGNTVVNPEGTKSITWNKGPSHGVISPDGKTITITCGPPVSLAVQASSGAGVPIPGTPANCVTSAVGIRLH